MNANYNWVDETLANVVELIHIGDPVSFHYAGNDYFIEGHYFDTEALGRVGSYIIQDPDVQPDMNFGPNQVEYPNSGMYKTPEELLNAPFLDGKSILERFDELKFFD